MCRFFRCHLRKVAQRFNFAHGADVETALAAIAELPRQTRSSAGALGARLARLLERVEDNHEFVCLEPRNEVAHERRLAAAVVAVNGHPDVAACGQLREFAEHLEGGNQGEPKLPRHSDWVFEWVRANLDFNYLSLFIYLHLQRLSGVEA